MTRIPVITAGDANFARTMVDLGVRYPDEEEEKPSNFEIIMTRLRRPRTDLATWTARDTQQFRKLSIDAMNEPTAFLQFDKLLGSSDPFVSARQLDMSNLEKLGPHIGNCKPDICDGVKRADLSAEIEKQLENYIIPNKANQSPCLPTWFMEVKGPTGYFQTAKDQAIRAGVLGERGVFRLRSKIDSTNAEDRKSHVITSTFSSSTQIVDIYCIHRASAGHYIMTELSSMRISNLDTFKEAATMLRNGREWTREMREALLRPVEMARSARLDVDVEQSGDEEEPEV